jgi:hypothetical protein
MPNCDFYAAPDDHEPLLTWLFADGACHVYELYSDFEQPLKRFASAAEVLSQFERCYPSGERWHSVHLQLYVLGASPPFRSERIALNPNACNGATFRYTAAGWGLIQLYLSAPNRKGLENSHTNHSNRRRAEAHGMRGNAWDFERITAFSSRLNRQIRKQAVAKLGSRVVLPGALMLWERDVSLNPYVPSEDAALLHPLSSSRTSRA